jgi:hypothetical protein
VVLTSSITLMMEAASTSETSADFYLTTRRNKPEDSHLKISYAETNSSIQNWELTAS